MKTKGKLPSLLTNDDIKAICGCEIISDSDETFSQTCVRFGNLLSEEEDMTPIHYVEDYLTPTKIALQSFCKDNPKITEEEFTTWYQGLIEDEELFRLDKHTDALLKDVHDMFDAQMNVWISKGALDANYPTDCIFWGIIILAINKNYEKMGCYKLKDNMFFNDPVFGKYKIVALDYADNKTLNDFDNPHSYNHFDVEGLIIYAMDEFDEYEDYRKTREIYQEVKDIVYDDPNRLLGETKKILEQQVKKDRKMKMQYAVLYAAAIIEWYLKHH